MVKTAYKTTRTRLRAWNPPAPPMTDFAAQTTMHHFRTGHRKTSVLNLVYRCPSHACARYPSVGPPHARRARYPSVCPPHARTLLWALLVRYS